MKGRFFTSKIDIRHSIFCVSLLLLFLYSPVHASDFRECSGCHRDTLNENMRRTYLHAPFREQQCGICHLEGEQSVSLKGSHPAAAGEQEKIRWLDESSVPDITHLFLVPADKLNDTLLVEMRGRRSPFARQEITVPPLADVPELADPGKPPVVSGVGVLEVKRGLFLSATIGWQTDTITDAAVRYGQNDLKQTSPKNNRFSREHKVVLHDLKADKTYKYSVVSNDLFGRRNVSEPLTFSTAKPFTAPESKIPGNSERPHGKDGLGSRFQRIGANYLLELTSNQPSILAIGTQKLAKGKGVAGGGSSKEADGSDDHHAGLTTKFAVTMQVCARCHPANNSSASHPVNVYPKPGMIIPAEYPTLPDRRITCMSCHVFHAANNELRLIKADKRALCTGCHRDME